MNPADELAPYPSPEGRATEVAALAARVGGELVEYGTSVEGRPLVAVRVPSTLSDRPRVFCGANIHGVEFIAGRVAIGLLRALADGAPRLVSLRSQAELWVVPSINPDGYARTFAAGGRGRLPHLRGNAHGVDLNRNYPRPGGAGPSWLPGAGSDRPGDATYRGPHPLSEPETAALDRLFRAQKFVAAANFHSFMGTLIPARVTDRRAYATYRRLCRTFRRAQPHHRYFRLASRIFDTFTGEQEDHQHHVHGTWAVCVETFTILASWRQHWRAPSVFWRFNPRDPAPWIENDVSGVCAYFAAALQLERPAAYDRGA